MKRKQLMLMLAAFAVSLSVIIVSCSKDRTDGSTTPQNSQNVSLFLTDHPGMYDAVNLDITSVEVLVDTSANTRKHDDDDWDDIGHHGNKHHDSTLIWEDLGVSAGVYDVLSLRNGVDTLLAQSNIPKGAIRLIRINLGTTSTVTVDSVTYPLQIPPGADGFILVKLRGDEWEHFSDKHFRLWLDFDVQRSIVKINSTTYYLRPVVSFFVVKNTGSIMGVVLPPNAKSVVTVFSSTDTAYAIPNFGGAFMVRGLPDGNYSAFVHSYNGYMDTTISNITVTNAAKVNVGVVLLHK